MKILHCSDFHLDHVTLGQSRLDEIEGAVWQTARKAVLEGCSYYLFTGDLCDPAINLNNYGAIRVAREIALYLAQNKIESFWLAGNHDVIEDGRNTSTLEALKNLAPDYVTICEQPGVERLCYPNGDNGPYLVTLPFSNTGTNYSPSEFIESLKLVDHDELVIVAGHLNIAGVVPGEETHEMPRGRDVMFPEKAVRALKNPTLRLNGHYHRRQVTKGGIHIPGTLARLTFGEGANQPGYNIYDIVGTDFGVEEVLVEGAEEMRTVAPDVRKIAGSAGFVRVQPSATSTDAEVEAAATHWGKLSMGVKVLPRPVGKVVLTKKGEPTRAKQTMREVVLKLTADSNSENKDRLGQVVEETLAAVGA